MKNVLTGIVSLLIASSTFADIEASATLTNNYLWRGLSQSMNNPAIQGGIEITNANVYGGTWVSNVEYVADDPFSYENDWYIGTRGNIAGFNIDIGYLYYNYDKDANFDFGEVYGTLSIRNLDLSLYVLTNTEADESVDQDFGFGQATYVSMDYTLPLLARDTNLVLHVGRHNGDFVTAFNGTPKTYVDYSVGLTKGAFEFKVSNTNLDNDTVGAPNDNNEVKFVASYSISI